MNYLFIFISIILFSISGKSFGLTFKSSGEIIASDGEVLTKSFADRYQNALTQFYNDEDVVDWPVVEFDRSGNPIKKKAIWEKKF